MDPRWSPEHFRAQAREAAQNKPISQVYIGGDNNYKPFMTSSSETVNQVVREVVDLAPQEAPCLESVEVNYYYDKNTLQPQALDELANKAANCERLTVAALCGAPATNLLWLNMAGRICQTSQNLKHLVIRGTRTTAEDGAAFLQQLAESDLTTLEHVDFTGHGSEKTGNWFGGKQKPVDHALALFAKQPQLNFLLMINCALTTD